LESWLEIPDSLKTHSFDSTFYLSFISLRMPTIILLDTSLSMMRFIKTNTSDQGTKKDIAHMIIQDLVEIIKRVDKYEQIALVSFWLIIVNQSLKYPNYTFFIH
jgi:hypothetical protein